MEDGYSLLPDKELRRQRMVTQRPFEELNLWQRIFAEHWADFAAGHEREHGPAVPEHWQENVERMLSCGDIREGYYEYYCQDCGSTKKVGFAFHPRKITLRADLGRLFAPCRSLRPGAPQPSPDCA